MSALTDLFTALANKIRSKTGTATTYTPLQMVSDGIDDVYAAGYDAGGGGAAGIPITPSDASPVNLTTGDSYQMLADGYAIESYPTSVTPTNLSPTSLSAGSIYKMDGNGKAVYDVTSITPSGGQGIPSMTAGNIYKPTDNCYALSNYNAIRPSDSSPVALTSPFFYRMAYNGYAIESYPTSVTPTASGESFSSGIKKMTTGGYAYTSVQKKTASGIQVMSTTGQTKITCGFKPNYIMAYATNTTSLGLFYNKDISTTKSRALNSGGNADYNLGTSTASVLYSVDNDGFTVNKASSARTYYWFASE